MKETKIVIKLLKIKNYSYSIVKKNMTILDVFNKKFQQNNNKVIKDINNVGYSYKEIDILSDEISNWG